MSKIPTNGEESNELPYGFRRLPVPEGKQEENWKAVEDAIRRRGAAPVRSLDRDEVVRRRIPWGRAVVAAACAIGLVFGIWYTATKTGHPQEASIRTGFGEIKNVLLPDSSTVVLNANSTLRIPENWTDKGGRQVWLEGEAYFQVKKGQSAGQKFVVHTREVDVEVLGTRFNVNTRRQRSIVSLEEGKVRLSVRGVESAVMVKKAPLIMRPGQVVTVNEELQAQVNDDKDVVARSGWSRHEFHFDNTSLQDIARLVEDMYGYKMVMEDTAMSRVAISGDLRVHNVQELVKVLELPSGYRMRIRGKTIYVTAN